LEFVCFVVFCENSFESRKKVESSKGDIMRKIKTAHGTENREVVSRKEWLAARVELLKAEKELTRRSDELAQRR
jgi:hypothetical protein